MDLATQGTDNAGIWLGALVSEGLLNRERATSPAGNQWQGAALSALRAAGLPLAVFGGTPHPAWPGGKLFAREHSPILEPIRVHLTGYLNLPVVKWLSQHARLRSAIRRYVSRAGAPAVVFSYNAGYPESETARWIRREYDVPWVCVVADYPDVTDPRVPPLRRWALDAYGLAQRRWIREADGVVYLSWKLYEQDYRPAKIYMEGGVDVIRADREGGADTGKKIVMYCGSLTRYTGVDLLLEAMRYYDSPDFELWISGRGDLKDDVERAAAEDSRIVYHGLVERGSLLHLMGLADVFVNPRPSYLLENQANFPSKVLEYLSWCRPVVSTLTPGMAPYYREVLEVVSDETPRGLAESLARATSLSLDELEWRRAQIRAFVEKNLSWNSRATHLIEWLQQNALIVAR